MTGPLDDTTRGLLAALDVHYADAYAVAACVVFQAWTDQAESSFVVERIEDVAPYEPGEFFRRELPCLERVLARITVPLRAIIVDGYVWLDTDARPGLGARLFEARGGRTPVIGVAKTAFQGSLHASPVVRGTSTKPLFVTAVGVARDDAARAVCSMHGEHRIPTLLGRVDALARRPPP